MMRKPKRQSASLAVTVAIAAIPCAAQAQAPYDDNECGVVVVTHAEADWAVALNPVAAFNQKVWVVQLRDGQYGAMIGTYPNAIAEERISYLKDRTLLPHESFCLPARDVVQIVNTTKTGHALPQDLGDYGKPPPPVAKPPRPPLPVEGEVLDAPALNPNSDVTILGLDWSMTKRQMVANLTERGYACAFETSFKGTFKCATPQGAKVTIYQDNFEINCAALSACDYSYDQIADDLLASYSIAELRPDTPDLMQIMAVGAGIGFCGPSNGGNHVCSIWSILTGTVVTVKAGEQGGGISFD